MSRQDDKIEEIEKWQIKREIEEGIRKGRNKWLITICSTATTATVAFIMKLGEWAYNHSGALKAAVDAYNNSRGQ